MDDLDVKILKILESNSRTPISTISQEINLSRCSIRERISKMINDDTIKSFTLDTCPYKKGYHSVFIVIIYETIDSEANLDDYLKTCPYIMQVYYTAGVAQYIFKAATPNLETMYQLIHDLQKMCRLETLLVLNTIDDKKLEPII